jgi:hypothetical protein
MLEFRNNYPSWAFSSRMKILLTDWYGITRHVHTADGRKGYKSIHGSCWCHASYLMLKFISKCRMPEKRLVWHQYFYCSSASIFWLQGQSESTSHGLVLNCPALIYIQIFHNAGIIYCCCNVDGYYQLGINWFSGLMQINPIHRSGKNCVLISL